MRSAGESLDSRNNNSVRKCICTAMWSDSGQAVTKSKFNSRWGVWRLYERGSKAFMLNCCTHCSLTFRKIYIFFFVARAYISTHLRRNNIYVSYVHFVFFGCMPRGAQRTSVAPTTTTSRHRGRSAPAIASLNYVPQNVMPMFHKDPIHI